MTKALQVKLLAGILAVLTVIAGLLIRGGQPIAVQASSHEEKAFAQKVVPSKRHALIP